jgi:hypothetical protein
LLFPFFGPLTNFVLWVQGLERMLWPYIFMFQSLPGVDSDSCTLSYMNSESPNGSSSLAPTPACQTLQQQPSKPAPTAADNALGCARCEQAQTNIVDEPQTVVARERLATAAARAMPTAQELVAAAVENEPILEGLEAYLGFKAINNKPFVHRYAKSAPLHQREVFSALPAFPAEVSSSAAQANYNAAPLASAPPTYPHLQRTAAKQNDQVRVTTKPKTAKGFSELEIPSAILFAAASQLYHSTFFNPALRVSAAAHFLNLILQSTSEKVASWEDICSWGALYGILSDDLRAAVALVGKEGIILNAST